MVVQSFYQLCDPFHLFNSIFFCPYTPQQNRLVERKHRHITEFSLATMFNAQIPQLYWLDIFESVMFVTNRLPTSPLEFDSPY
jgi:hypothetical protein